MSVQTWPMAMPNTPLTAADQVDDLGIGVAQVDPGTVADQGDRGQVGGAAAAQRGQGGADVGQGHPGDQQPLDDLEDQDVTEAVEPVGSRSARGPQGGFDQAGAGPVVELPAASLALAATLLTGAVDQVSGVVSAVRGPEGYGVGDLGFGAPCAPPASSAPGGQATRCWPRSS